MFELNRSMSVALPDRLIHAEILQARLLGFDTHLVASKFYASGADFDLWFHAAREFDFFASTADGKLDSAEITLDSYHVRWSSHRFQHGKLRSDDLCLSDRFVYRNINQVLLDVVNHIEYLDGFFDPIIADLSIAQNRPDSNFEMTVGPETELLDTKFHWNYSD